jgi:hypothetical protein
MNASAGAGRLLHLAHDRSRSLRLLRSVVRSDFNINHRSSDEPMATNPRRITLSGLARQNHVGIEPSS